MEGTPVRVSGQDTRRGTFSQRHAVLIDNRTEERYFPLQHLSEGQAPFLIYDSPLNEFATLGFEYGVSVVAKEALVCWEAQFGDFVNEAEVIVDQFIASAEDKWGQTSGLVLLLPHGFEGQGPEHSSARIERFLQLAAGDNLQVVVPSTPAVAALETPSGVVTRPKSSTTTLPFVSTRTFEGLRSRCRRPVA